MNMFISELDFMNNKAVGKFIHNGILRGILTNLLTCFIGPGGTESKEFRLHKA